MNNRVLITAVLAGFITLVVTAFIKPYFENSKTIAQPSTDIQKVDQQPTGPATRGADGDKMLVLPAHVGLYILGAGATTGLCIILAALLIRKPQK